MEGRVTKNAYFTVDRNIDNRANSIELDLGLILVIFYVHCVKSVEKRANLHDVEKIWLQ